MDFEFVVQINLKSIPSLKGKLLLNSEIDWLFFIRKKTTLEQMDKF